MVIYGYARHTIADKDFELQQKTELAKAGCEQTYVDVADVWNRERPELQRVLKQLRSGDTLVVTRLDRLAQGISELVSLVCSLRQREVHIYALNERIDTRDKQPHAIDRVFLALAAYEKSLSLERQMLAIRPKRGRKRKLNAESVQAIRARHKNGEPVVGLTADFGISRATVHRILKEQL